MISFLVCAGLLAAVVLFLIQSQRNRAITLEEAVKTAASDISVQEKRRIDLVYNLADCVKEYDKHEADILSGLADKMRSEPVAGDTELHSTLRATAYSYPDLKSSALYINLMNELSMTENFIARSRENYNASVNDYERYIRQFPANVLLPFTGYINRHFERLDYSVSEDDPQDLFGRRTKRGE